MNSDLKASMLSGRSASEIVGAGFSGIGNASVVGAAFVSAGASVFGSGTRTPQPHRAQDAITHVRNFFIESPPMRTSTLERVENIYLVSTVKSARGLHCCRPQRTARSRLPALAKGGRHVARFH